MQWTETFGYLGALMTLTTFSMKTMVHLRMVGIVSNVAFIAYGVLGHVYPVLLLHLALLPLNIWRLRQLLQLTRQIREIAGSRLSMEWLKPFSRRRAVRAGETLFRRGDAAAEVLFVLSGRFRAIEADVVVGQGEIIGELGLITKEHKRTQTVVCEQAGLLLSVTYDEVRQMYYQNPRFGFFFLELVAERLMRDARREGPPDAAFES
jgi:hypothetical protein